MQAWTSQRRGPRPDPVPLPTPSFSSPLRPSLRTLGLALPALLVSPSCNDNVGCVFIGGCDGDPVPPNPALEPVAGEWIASAAPDIESVLPTGTGHRGTTPIVIVFSETIQLESVAGAFEVLREGLTQPLPVAQALVSEGRVLLLLPSTTDPLDPGVHVVRLKEDATVIDLGGQQLDREPGAEVGRFTVDSAPPAEPQLVTTFPKDDATSQGESLELVVVFDRPVESSSITPQSFDVRVGGANPVPDPPARALRVGTPPGIEDTRVFLYQRVDADGLPLPFGRSAQVEVRLSPAGSEILDADEDEDDDELDAITVGFQTLAFAPPLAASLLSDPFDAIGLANLTDQDPEELMVEVELDQAQPNDDLDLYLFGDHPDEEDPFLISLLRTKRLSGTAPIQSAIFTREEIAMGDPGDVRFKDGPVTFAFVLRRGNATSPIFVLDLDSDPATILDPQLDTTAPTLDSWAGSTGTAEFRSDLRDLALAGEANELVRGVEVSTPLGDSDSMAPVTGSDDSGFFLAATVEVGRLVGGTTTFSAVLRDHAQNPTGVIEGDYRQRGGLGPDAFTPGQSIEVEVFSAATLLPVSGARVLVHSDLGDGVNFPFFGSGTTLSDGRVTVVTSGSPAVGAILTVVQPGFDLFTLHGVSVTRLSVPLEPTAQDPAEALGRVETIDPAALAIAGLDRRFDDSRRDVGLRSAFVGGDCGLVNGLFGCAYGSEEVRANRLGARSFFAGDFTSLPGSADLLQAFALLVPLRAPDPGDPQPATIELGGLLPADPGDPEAAQHTPPFQFRLPVSSGLVPPFLDDAEDPGLLRAGVETLVPGLGGSLAVGPALSIDAGPDLWTVQGTYPGAITAAGSLGGAERVDSDPFVRTELVDQTGNAVGLRPRVSTLDAGGTTEIVALRVPVLLAPTPGTPTGGQAFTLRLAHSIGDERSAGGLYRAELRDTAGRRWILWRFDGPGSADVSLRVVDVGDAGIAGLAGLADGNIAASAAAFAWQGFSATDLLWSDVEREFELFSRTAEVLFQKP